jgi:hypothetical protein
MIGRLTPIAFVAGPLSLAAAALLAGGVPEHPRWWGAALALAILAGIAPVIVGVNIRVVPVFARRTWRDPALLALAIGGLLAGGWGMALGRALPEPALERAWSAAALVGGLAFIAALARLFRHPPAATPAPPLPYPDQAVIDRIAIRFTRLSGMMLIVGLVVGAVRPWWTPAGGRWDLVWAHALLVGFVLCMIHGTAYHVLARWTTARWRSPRLAVWHWRVTAVALPLMLVALAVNERLLFMIAGPAQALAIGLWLLHAAPLLAKLPGPSRGGALAAIALLAVGVTLGGLFAHEPWMGPRLRLAHADLNVFGAVGLFITAFGTYFVPRFAGRPFRWPRFAVVPPALLAGGVIAGAALFAWRAYGGDVPGWGLPAAHAVVAAGYLALAALFAQPFLAARRAPAVTVSTISLGTRRPGGSSLPRA